MALGRRDAAGLVGRGEHLFKDRCVRLLHSAQNLLAGGVAQLLHRLNDRIHPVGIKIIKVVIIIYRISWYFMIGLIALFSQLYAPGKAVTASGLTLILMSILLYMRILIVWGVLIYPYKTFFTNGIREGDYIHSENEYDHRYNYDKFYK